MVAIANLSTSNTFGQWLTSTNLVISEVNKITGASGLAALSVANTMVANVLSVRTSATFSGTATFANTTAVTFGTANTITVTGGSTGQVLIKDASGYLTWSTPVTSFSGLSGTIANSQFYGSLGISSNTTFSANVNLGTVSKVKITGGSAGQYLKQSTVGGALVFDDPLADGSVTTVKISDYNVTAAKIANTIDLSAKTVTLAAVFARTDTQQTYSKGQAGSTTDLGTLTANDTLQLANTNHYRITLGDNITLPNPNTTNAVGQGGSIVLKQDGTGSRTVSWGSYWKFPGNTAPTLTTTANAEDRIDYFVSNSTFIHAVASLNYF